MSREFIDAIESGNNLEAEDEFNNSISSKVGDALEFRRKEISQNFAGNNGLVEEESKPYVKQKPDGTWCVYDAEGNVVSEHESEDEAKAALPNKKYEDDEEDDEVDEGASPTSLTRRQRAGIWDTRAEPGEKKKWGGHSMAKRAATASKRYSPQSPKKAAHKMTGTEFKVGVGQAQRKGWDHTKKKLKASDKLHGQES